MILNAYNLNKMHKVVIAAQLISFASFLFYGLCCFFSKWTADEFVRYGLEKSRILTGVLQVAASLGLLLGFYNRPILLLSSGGLAVMMFLAVVTRFKIRDPLTAALPAFSLFALNVFIFVAALR
jgi:hypothetical protein